MLTLSLQLMHMSPELKLEQLMLDEVSPEAKSRIGVYQAEMLLRLAEMSNFQVRHQIAEGHQQQS